LTCCNKPLIKRTCDLAFALLDLKFDVCFPGHEQRRRLRDAGLEDGTCTCRVLRACISYPGGGELLGWVRDEFRKGRVYILRYFSYSVRARSNPRAAKLTL
jgi:hypothetical protein